MSDDAPLGTVLSGTGGVWRVRLADGSIVDATMRGRLKKGEDDRKRGLASGRKPGRPGGGRGRAEAEAADVRGALRIYWTAFGVLAAGAAALHRLL